MIQGVHIVPNSFALTNNCLVTFTVCLEVILYDSFESIIESHFTSITL